MGVDVQSGVVLYLLNNGLFHLMTIGMQGNHINLSG